MNEGLAAYPDYYLDMRLLPIYHTDSKGTKHFLSLQTGRNGQFAAALVFVPTRHIGFAIMANSKSTDLSQGVQQWLSTHYN